MLLPALNKARAKAQAITCTNNLRQLSFSAITYTDDYDGYITPIALPVPNITSQNHFWPRTLIYYKYASFKIFSCPTGLSKSTVSIPWINTVVNLWKSGADDTVTLGENENGYTTTTGTYPYAYPSYGMNSRMSTIPALKVYKNTARKLFLAESRDGANRNVGRYIGSNTILHGKQGSLSNTSSQISVVHGSSTNLAWLDGHVSSMNFPNIFEVISIYDTIGRDVWLENQ